MKRPSILIIVASALMLLVASPAQATPKQNSNSTLTVFAAASLGQTFTAIGKQFQDKHPGVKVQFSFLASSNLATQILAGAPADVFASASISDMAMAKSLVPASTIFTANRVIIATPLGNKFHMNKPVDLNKRGLKWIQCAHNVPCGAAADAALAYEGRITSKPVSLEPNVSSVVTKVVDGEVDAAIIYHTDYVAHRSMLKEIRFKGISASTTQYPIGVVETSPHQQLARSFVESVLSAYGRKILAEAGFISVK